jgi:hypothetical protein
MSIYTQSSNTKLENLLQKERTEKSILHSKRDKEDIALNPFLQRRSKEGEFAAYAALIGWTETTPTSPIRNAVFFICYKLYISCLLYEANAILAVRSQMNGLKWLGCFGLKRACYISPLLNFFLFLFSFIWNKKIITIWTMCTSNRIGKFSKKS